MKWLFARVGNCIKYNGDTINDRPRYGGIYNNEHIGHEIFNYKEYNGYYYGTFYWGAREGSPGKKRTTNFKRIDPSEKGNAIENILIIWVAQRVGTRETTIVPLTLSQEKSEHITHIKKVKIQGQSVIGWYDNAIVYRESQPRPDVSGYDYRCKTLIANGILLPVKERFKSKWEVPKAPPAPGFGTSNIYYPLERDGEPRSFNFIERILKNIKEYDKKK